MSPVKKTKKKNSNVGGNLNKAEKKVTDARKLMKQRESLLEQKVKNKMLAKDKMLTSKSNGLFKNSKKIISIMPTNLSLSESSSSEDENEKPSQVLTKIKSPLKASSTIIPPNQNLSGKSF